jgi:conjugal transfer pilus assembly protein TraU
LRTKTLVILLVLSLTAAPQAFAAMAFNSATDIDYSQIDYTVVGVCSCGEEEGTLYSYWEPFLAIDTSATAYYSAYLGSSMGSGSGGAGIGSFFETGKNTSQDSVDNGESTFTQAHGWLMPLMQPLCSRTDYGLWLSEFDVMWQSDLLTEDITPEAALFANKAMQLACMLDATAVNIGLPMDVLFWCVGSGGSAYPLTGRVADDNIVQADSTVAAKLIYKLNRLGLICDPALGEGCGCSNTPVWVKSHYKMSAVRPNISGTYILGKSALIYGHNENPPYEGPLGPEDQFLWVVYRLKFCCSCCN